MIEKHRIRQAELNPAQIAAEEKEISEVWGSRVEGFLRDGVVNAEKYCKSSPRILVVLKEMNDYSDPNGLIGHLQEGGRDRRTWNATSRWMYGIRHLHNDLEWSLIASMPHKKDFRIKYLSDIAVINVKKTTGGHTADATAIDLFVQDQENRKWLKRQVEIYQPDIVICGGTSWWYQEFMEEQRIPRQKTTKGVEFFVESTGTIVICFNHPDARVPENYLFYMLMDAVRELIG